MQAAYIAEGSPLCNEDHEHLRGAHIGVLWTNVQNSKQMKMIAGTAEIPNVQGSKWIKARAEFQMVEWFGTVPDFLITLYAPYCADADHASFLALCEHECYHCAQAVDVFGEPKFRLTGEPAFAMRGHDAEEFVGVVRRYGVGAAANGVAALVRAANQQPEVAVASITSVCGTCLRLAA